MMDTKAAFEKWWEDIGCFANCSKKEAIIIWQASRAAIEIEFPNLSDDKFCWSDGVFNLKEDISNKLTSHGIRIKGKTE